MSHNIAQFNVAWLREPLDHPSIAEFEQAIDPLHEDADSKEGFVWRLIADGTESATSLRPLGDDGIINLTVWQSKEAMAEWVYKTGHAWTLKKRRKWFYPALESNVVMWWVPKNTTPTLLEAISRLQYLRSFGSSPLAFLYKDKFSPQDAEEYQNDVGNPSLLISGIVHQQAERIIDRYLECWNTDDEELNNLNNRILTSIRSWGICVPSSALIDEKFAIRPAFVGPNTEIADAELFVEEILLAGDAECN